MEKTKKIRSLFSGNRGEGSEGSGSRIQLPFRKPKNKAASQSAPSTNEASSPPVEAVDLDHHAPALVDLESSPLSCPTAGFEANGVDLWGQAYQKLTVKNPDLIAAYESILAKTADISHDLPLNEKITNVISTKLSVISSRQWKLRIPYQHDSLLVRGLVEKLLRIAQKLQLVGTVVANVDPIHVGLPFAGICILIQLITNDSQQHKAVLNGINEVTDLITVYTGVEGVDVRSEEIQIKKDFVNKLLDLYLYVLEFLAKATCHFDLNTAQRLLRNIPKLDDWDAQMRKIRGIENICQRLATKSAFEKQSNDMKSLAELLEAQRTSLQEFLEAQRTSLQELVQTLGSQSEENSKIVRWVSMIDVESDHSIVRQKLGTAYAESGQWLRPKYENWRELLDKPTFWLYGSAGTGKSSLVSIVIEWHLSSIKSNDQDRLAYFYCSRKRTQRNQPVDILASFVAQLAWSVDGLSVANSIKALYSPDSKRKLSLKECSELLTILILPYRNVTIVIDALDECSDYNQLLRHLRIVSNGTGNRVKFFLSSRRNCNIFPKFPAWTKLELDLQQELTGSDIKCYIRSQVLEREALDVGSRLLEGEYPDIEERLVETLFRRAQGMFRWAELQLAAFLGPNAAIHHPKDATNKLEKLERETGMPELNHAYEEIYQMNTVEESESRVIATRAYKWILSAQRQLRIEELAEAVSYDINRASDSAITPELITKVCSNFLFADESRVVQFAHLSAREYLEKRESSSIREYSETKIHTQAAISCLAFLNHCDFGKIRYYEDEQGFPEYAACFWTVHLQMSYENRNCLP